MSTQNRTEIARVAAFLTLNATLLAQTAARVRQGSRRVPSASDAEYIMHIFTGPGAAGLQHPRVWSRMRHYEHEPPPRRIRSAPLLRNVTQRGAGLRPQRMTGKGMAGRISRI